jgi:hypothetical protein
MLPLAQRFLQISLSYYVRSIAITFRLSYNKAASLSRFERGDVAPVPMAFAFLLV